MPPVITKKPEQKLDVIPRLLVVCWGNVCRSPLAAAVLRQELGVEIREAGVGTRGGHVAAKKVREYAASVGLDLSGHKSVPITSELLSWAQIVVYMDGRNLGRLLELGASEARTLCLAAEIGQDKIPDPAYTPRGAELDRILGDILRASRILANRLKEKTR